MSTTSIEQLEKEIEGLIRAHIAACRARAAAAVERAFSTAKAGRSSGSRTGSPSRTAGRRRPGDEIAALGERLHQAVCANPGAPMTTLAAAVGASARELSRPVQLLKRSGRIRSVGQRQATRYFPIASKRA